MRRDTNPNRAERGYSLLELIVVLTIATMMAGIVAPYSGHRVEQRRLEVDTENLNIIARQLERYYEDTLSVPASLQSLAKDDGVAGWDGPYIEEYYDASSPYTRDSHGNDFKLTSSNHAITVTSLGNDGALGTADDIVVQANLQTIRRRITMARVDVVNRAILRYLGNRSSEVPPLPFASAELFHVLIADGYLENDPKLTVDGWGNSLVAFPKDAIWAISAAAVTSTQL